MHNKFMQRIQMLVGASGVAQKGMMHHAAGR